MGEKEGGALQGNRRVERFLVACVQGEGVRESAAALDGAFDAIASVATFHGVAAFVSAATAGSGLLPSSIEAALRDQAMRTSVLATTVTMDLSRAAHVFDAEGIDYVVLKGPVLDQAVYRRPGLRSYNDLDLLVRPGDLGRAVDALEQDGFSLLDRNWTVLLDQMEGEVHLEAPTATVVDLHWHVLNESALRSVFRIDGDSLVDRRRTVEVGPLSVSSLEPAAMTVHVALHACLSGADRLVWIKDVEQCATVPDLDWDTVVRLAEQWRVAQPVAVSLRRATDLLGLEIPKQVQRHLGLRRGYVAMSAAVDAVRPVLGSGRRTPARLMARSTRQSSAASIRELARRASMALRHLGRDDGDRVSRDRTDPQSVLYPSGSLQTRSLYFERVAASVHTAPQAG